MVDNKFFIKSEKPQNVQVGSGSVIQDYGSKDPDPKEIFYGSTTLDIGTFIYKIFCSQGF
jgi:hypothetical protein